MTNYFRVYWTDLNYEAQDGIKEVIRERIKDDEALMEDLNDMANNKAKEADPTMPYEAIIDEVIEEEVDNQLKNLEIKGEV